jgi:hypothetical protein
MKLVTVHTAFNPADAELVRSRLEAAEFNVSVKNEIAATAIEGYGLTVGGIQVQVPDDEADDARALLNAPPIEG